MSIDTQIIGNFGLNINLDLVGRNGIPNSVREELLQQGRGNTALVLDLAYRLGWREGDKFTVQGLLSAAHRAGVAVGEGLVRRGLRDRVFNRYITRKGRGRPGYSYRLPGITDLARMVSGGSIKATDQLRDNDLVSLKAYRAGLHRAFIARRPGIYSRAFLSYRLGVSERATWNYERGSDIKATPQYDRTEVTDWRTLPAKGGGRESLEIRKGLEVRVLPMVRFLAYRYMKQGWEVTRRKQTGNYYEIRQLTWGDILQKGA
jgi:hypothetical protein